MKTTIMGLGLIGSSIARALHDKTSICAIDRDEEVIHQALAERVIDDGGTGPEVAEGSDVLIIALPVKSICPAAEAVIPFLPEKTVITDTGSTKTSIVNEISKIWPRYIGSHPMAGAEDSGYTSGRSDLFESSLCILTPNVSTPRDATDTIREIWRLCGARSVEITPEEHDHIMACLSHMPHLLSFAMMGLVDDVRQATELAGKGFWDFTRIAGSDAVMWKDILIENRSEIIPLMDRYIYELDSIRKLITSRDEKALEKKILFYQTTRRKLDEDNR